MAEIMLMAMNWPFVNQYSLLVILVVGASLAEWLWQWTQVQLLLNRTCIGLELLYRSQERHCTTICFSAVEKFTPSGANI